LTQVAFARHLGIPVQRVYELVRGKRGVTPATAWLLSQSLKTTPGFWMSLQADHDLYLARPETVVRPIEKAF
jgi:addiction module HigA family antidote